jgi:hypothetical protein
MKHRGKFNLPFYFLPLCICNMSSVLHGLKLRNIYVGESNKNRKTEIKIRNIAPLSYKLADMLPML